MVLGTVLIGETPIVAQSPNDANVPQHLIPISTYTVLNAYFSVVIFNHPHMSLVYVEIRTYHQWFSNVHITPVAVHNIMDVHIIDGLEM